MQGVLTGFAVIAVVIGVGYVLGLRGHLGPQGREVLTKLAFHVASPALLFTTLATADLSVVFSARLLVTALSTLAVAGAFVAVGVVRGWGVGRTTIGACAPATSTPATWASRSPCTSWATPRWWRRCCCSSWFW